MRVIVSYDSNGKVMHWRKPGMRDLNPEFDEFETEVSDVSRLREMEVDTSQEEPKLVRSPERKQFENAGTVQEKLDMLADSVFGPE